MCTKHPTRRATGACRACEQPCCADCLVFSFGRLREPYCVPCALVASGVHPVVPSEAATDRR